MASGIKLTKRHLDSLRPTTSGDIFVWDAEVTGFGVRVKPSGTKSFIFRYRPHTGGHDRKLTIGRYPSLSLEDARERGRELYLQKSKGGDPAIDRKAARSALTLEALADYYLGPHSATKGNRPATLAEYRRALDKHVLKKYGNRKLSQFSKSDVTNLIHQLATTPIAANRLKAVLSAMYGVAVDLGWATENPCLGVVGYREKARERYLNVSEQKSFVQYLSSHRNQDAADVVRLLLLTGARRGEVLNATWEMFDLINKVWVKPSHHTKQNREHIVALPDAAIQIIMRRSEKLNAHTRFIFPQRSDFRKPIVGIKRFWTCLQSDLCMEGLRIHDLRHTSASVLLSAGHSLAEVGSTLGHTQSRTTERYAHIFNENKHRSAATLGAAFGNSA